MIKFISLNMVTGAMEEATDEDGLRTGTEQTTPVRVRVDAIRNFYPRKPTYSGPRVGTRITFTDGAGMAVREVIDEVEAAIAAVQAA